MTFLPHESGNDCQGVDRSGFRVHELAIGHTVSDGSILDWNIPQVAFVDPLADDAESGRDSYVSFAS